MLRHFSHLKWLKVIIKWFTFNSLTKQMKNSSQTATRSVFRILYSTWWASSIALTDSHFLSVSREKEINFFQRNFFRAITRFIFYLLLFAKKFYYKKDQSHWGGWEMMASKMKNCEVLRWKNGEGDCSKDEEKIRQAF